MSIKQQRTLTEKSIAAHQENARMSRGPATPEGRQRQRDACLRHGFYSQDRDTALRALGEDPADFDAMVRAVREKYPPLDGFEEALGMRLARALWRMDRADRMQEGYALRQAQEASLGRENHLHSQMMKLKMTGASLQSLAHSVEKKHYVTTPADLAMMKNLLPEESLKELGDILLALFMQLQGPGEHDEEGKTIDPLEQSRRAMRKLEEIFGLAGDHPPTIRGPVIPGQEPPPVPPPVIKKPAPPPKPQGPQLSRAEWAKREPVRQLLENMLARQAALCEAQRTAILRNCLAGPSSFERAAEIAPIHPNAVFMQRMQDSAFREVWRISNLLLKLHRQAPPPDNHENCPESAYEGDTPAPPFRSDFDPEGGSIDAVTEPAVEPAQAEAEQSFPPTQSEVTPTSQSPCPNAKVARAASTCRIRTFKNVTLPDTRQKTREKDVKKPTSQSARAGARVSPIVSPCRIQPFRNATSVDAHRKSRKKDVKMKVYPDNSNRISKASQGTPKGVVFAGNGSPPA